MLKLLDMVLAYEVLELYIRELSEVLKEPETQEHFPKKLGLVLGQ